MTQKNYILQELKELNSSLANLSQQNVYSVPNGYFDGLAAEVMNRIRSIEAAVTEEQEYSSELLNTISNKNPYQVLTGYFEGLADNILKTIKANENHQTAKEEIAELSPLLSGLKKEMPYSVPAGYFETLSDNIIATENKPASKVVSFGARKWIRYAAAAVITGVIFMAGFLYIGNNNNTATEPGSKVMAKITRDVKKMNFEEQDDLIEFIDAGLNGKESAQTKNKNKSTEIQDLLIGISDDELIDFKEQSEDIQSVLMVN